MKLLNLCCGAVRPQSEEWTNLDLLLPVLGRHSEEWKNLQQEKNYIEHDVNSGPLPFQDETFDGILASHCVEHWDCQEAARIMGECRRVLKPGGELLVSVPDAACFREHWHEDTVENAERIFGEKIHLPDGETTFLGYALFNKFHRAVLGEDALWTYFVRSGFWGIGRLNTKSLANVSDEERILFEGEILSKMTPHLNRLPFSLIMCATKE